MLRFSVAHIVMRAFIVVVIALLLLPTDSDGQSNLVRNRLKKVALGQADDVRRELPDLLADFPNDPGVRFLHAVLVEDAVRSLPLYEKIVQDYPDSEWADDAQWRIVQILSLRREAQKAREALAEYRKKYPDSEFLIYAVETVKLTVGLTDADRPTPQKVAEKAVTPETVKNRSQTSEHTRAVDKKGMVAEQDTKVASPAASNPAVSSGTRYTLQVGLYSTLESAQAELDRFTQYRMRANIIEKQINNTTKFAVTIGDYSTRESADRARKTVQKYCSCTPFVVAKD